MPNPRSGRNGTGDPVYRANRARLLATSDMCWLCHHPGARTADHVISHKHWPRDLTGRLLPGFNDLANLAPAHGTLDPGRTNPCPTCGRLCNQSKGARHPPSRHSRQW